MSDLWETAAKIGLSALLAGAIGAEREWNGKWAGLRTHMLIAVGSALLTHVSIQVGLRYAGGSNAWDPGRIAAQIVSGVGFIGAGTILQSRGTIHGLTTAAGLWVAAAIGLAVGAGFYGEATVTTAALLVILIALPPVERRLLRGDRRTVAFHLEDEQRLSSLLEVLEREEIEVREVSLDRGDAPVAMVRFRGSRADERRLLAAAARGDFRAVDDDAPGHPRLPV